ncbi:protein kinase family protein [Actinacidiphila alni]|uniref:protein kinase family protein n=1 Tax=Actinacidiphila alni TaxID=380248 RepID=UPI00345380EF
MADRSTAAVGVANEGGEPPLAAQHNGATPDGTTTDDQTSSSADSGTRSQDDNKGEHTAEREDEHDGEDEGDNSRDRSDSRVPAGGPDRPDGRDDPQATAELPATDTRESPTVALTATADAKGTRTATKAGKAATGAAKAATATGTGTTKAVRTTATAKAPGTAKPAGTEKAADTTKPAAKPARSAQPDLHSGHKLARRYQLAECVTRIDGFSSWRAVDEKLRRAVGIHVLPADHRRARQVLAAARSAALLGDPRFVQVLDAVEENDLVYVIHEWLPDASSLADLLAAGALEPHEAYQMVSQVSQGMAAAHREGLAHLRLDPGAVLRTVSGQYRIRGLAVAAALRGLSSDRPQRQDTEAIGALLYASLTQRWPYEEDAHGLAGLPKGVGLVAPDQVRAGVHRGLSELAMRALVNDGATASRQEPPCTTPEELAKAVAGIPRIRPPEQAPPVYPVAAFRQPPAPPGVPAPPVPAATPPPALPGRTGRVLKWAVSALLLVAIGLGSWQLADALKSREDQPAGHTPTGQKAGQDPTTAAPSPLKIAGLKDFDPAGDGTENPESLPNADDGDAATFWQTLRYNGADLGNLKPGVGVVVDLGSAKHVSTVTVDFIGDDTTSQLLAAPKATSVMPTQLSGFTKVADASGAKVTFKPTADLTTRYLLVWLTHLPPADGGFRGKISEISVTG